MVYCRGAHPACLGRKGPLNANALAKRIVEIASDKQASDIVLLDIRPVSLIADYFVVCTSASERQTNAIVRDITDAVREQHGARPLRVEGKPGSGWVLMDYGDVVVHVFGAEQRAFYQLEDLWSAAVPLVHMQ
jgi:ribosome-associated protein